LHKSGLLKGLNCGNLKLINFRTYASFYKHRAFDKFVLICKYWPGRGLKGGEQKPFNCVPALPYFPSHAGFINNNNMIWGGDY